MSEVLLKVIGLNKKFGENEVLKSITTDICVGEKVVVLGPSGSGKSTFLRCLNCMEDPTGGSIIFQGEDIADVKVDINKHRENIGMVFQQFNLFNNKTVLQNITLVPTVLGLKKMRKKMTKNFWIKFTNLFTKNKKELVAIETTCLCRYC